MDESVKAGEHWSRHFVQESSEPRRYWWQAGRAIDRRLNEKISGNPEADWVHYSMTHYLSDRLPLARCLSLGCGTGHLERRLAAIDAFVQCDAYDVAAGGIAIAQAEAARLGFQHIQYAVADANRLALPAATYDAVFVNAAMHHFHELEAVCRRLRDSLKPEGFLFLNEYIGPSRFQFPARQRELINCCLLLLPTAYRTKPPWPADRPTSDRSSARSLAQIASRVVDKLRGGDFGSALYRKVHDHAAASLGHRLVRERVVFPTEYDVMAVDPSEAVRSAEIVSVLQEYFEIVAYTGLGGQIVQFLLADIAGNFADDDPCAQELLAMLFAIEDALETCGELRSDFAYIVATPKPIMTRRGA